MVEFELLEGRGEGGNEGFQGSRMPNGSIIGVSIEGEYTKRRTYLTEDCEYIHAFRIHMEGSEPREGSDCVDDTWVECESVWVAGERNGYLLEIRARCEDVDEEGRVTRLGWW